jgi:hypothetical protein
MATRKPEKPVTDGDDKQQDSKNINNQNDTKAEDNEMIAPLSGDHKSSATSSNVNNSNINNGNNSNGKKRKTPEGKLAIDLNDRSKYTEEVSV